jgi:hypothetical protein
LDELGLRFRQRSREAVRAVAPLGASTMAVLVSNRVEVWNRDGQVLVEIQASDALALAATAGCLGVAYGDRVVLHVRQDEVLSVAGTAYRFDALVDIYADVWTGAVNSFVLAGRTRAATIALSSSGDVRVLAEYPGAVVPLRGQRAGHLFVTTDGPTGKVRIFAPGRMAML